MIKPFAAGKRWTLYHCDALALLADLPDASIDGLVTDAPYSSGGSFRGDRTGSVTDKYLSSGSKQAEYLPQFAGDNRDQRAGVSALASGRSFIGAERTEENAEVCARRLEQAENDGVALPLFRGAT